MEIKSNLCSNAIRKIALLITKASDLGMDISGHGIADENPNSGNIYIWLEDYPFILFIGLGSDTIKAHYQNRETDEEHETEDFKTLHDLYSWSENLENA